MTDNNEALRIALLSRMPDGYSTNRIRETAEKRGHTVEIMDAMKFGIYVEEENPELTYAGKTISEFDAVIPRIGSSVTFFGTAIVRQFEQMGVFSLSASQAISVSRDKLRSLQVLSRHDIGIPQSAFVKRKKDVLPAIRNVGGAPVIVKLLEGTQGIGVILADNEKVAEAIIETLQFTKQNLLIQKFVSESRGKDVRAFVIGDQVVAAMRRRAVGTEFRSNVHRGGTIEAVTLDEDYERTAVMAAQIMGLRVAGVDLLESEDGPVVMEVNSSPGLEGIEKATGVDIALAMVEYLEEHLRYDDLDITQRLKLTKGYTVAEVPVSDMSTMANKTIEDAGLNDMEITILSIDRQGLTIPVPKGQTEIFPGDILLCYGKKLTLRGLLPDKKPVKRKKKSKQKSSDGESPA